jgi:hypothetical protein
MMIDNGSGIISLSLPTIRSVAVDPINVLSEKPYQEMGPVLKSPHKFARGD